MRACTPGMQPPCVARTVHERYSSRGPHARRSGATAAGHCAPTAEPGAPRWQGAARRHSYAAPLVPEWSSPEIAGTSGANSAPFAHRPCGRGERWDYSEAASSEAELQTDVEVGPTSLAPSEQEATRVLGDASSACSSVERWAQPAGRSFALQSAAAAGRAAAHLVNSRLAATAKAHHWPLDVGSRVFYSQHDEEVELESGSTSADEQEAVERKDCDDACAAGAAVDAARSPEVDHTKDSTSGARDAGATPGEPVFGVNLQDFMRTRATTARVLGLGPL